MDYIEILQEMLRYIDANIKEKLSLEKLAERSGFSKYHFYRVFQWEVGYSLMEYVRNRRLFYAAAELASGRRIVDIAVDYGFETHSGFSKAFRRYFGSSPEKYRLYASFNVPMLPILKKTKQYVTGGIIMEPKMELKPAVKLAGFVLKTNREYSEKIRENLKDITSKFWVDCTNDGRMKKLHEESFLKNHNEYSVCIIENLEKDNFEYVIGVEVKDGYDISQEYYVYTIPEALYAVFRTPPADQQNFGSAISGTWKYIFSEWLPSSEYEFAENGVEFTLCDERCRNETVKVCDIYIPVVKKIRRMYNHVYNESV